MDPSSSLTARRALFDSVVPPARLRRIIDSLAEKAAEGDVRAASLLFNYLYGRPQTATPEPPPPPTPAYDYARLNDEELDEFKRLAAKCALAPGDGGGEGAPQPR